MAPIIDIFSNNLEELHSLQSFLEKEAFSVSVYKEVSEKNINEIYKHQPDVILMDLDIENSDGIELCHQLKVENAINSFIVLFTHHQEEYIQIEAFKAGVDDYIVLPIAPKVLVKRIKALLKRKPIKLVKSPPKILSFHNLKIDRESYLVYKDNESITLPRKEFEMLYLLMNDPQKVFSREEIYQKVWNVKSCSNTRIIDVHIRKIREKIGEQSINTVKGVGYQLA